jgi:hypothetical protein
MPLPNPFRQRNLQPESGVGVVQTCDWPGQGTANASRVSCLTEPYTAPLLFVACELGRIRVSGLRHAPGGGLWRAF